MHDWDPDLYLEFKSERTQPAIDLVAKIKRIEPESIIDVGCGPGNSTQVLADRWPNARITGLDSSGAMIQEAKRACPEREWVAADAVTYAPDAHYNLVFSNAAIQWMPNHEKLLAKFHGWLSEDGVLAIQIPLHWDMPLGRIIHLIARSDRWRAQTEGVSERFTIHNFSYYYDLLSVLFDSIDLWETQYIHVLDSHESMIRMMRGTGLKPYLEKLDDAAEIEAFEAQIKKGIEAAYPIQADGNVLLPFKRLFFVGYKG